VLCGFKLNNIQDGEILNFRKIETGQKLEIEIYEETTGDVLETLFTSEFESAVDDYTAIIATPIHEGVIYPVRKNALINVYYIYNMNLYRFKAKVVERVLVNNISLLKIGLISEIFKNQRRSFYRFEVIRELMAGLFIEDSEDPMEYHNAITIDISGGGFCIRCNEEYKVNDFLKCILKLNGQLINAIGRLVRVDQVTDDSKYQYEYGMVFKSISRNNREEIIRYIFRQQRKLMEEGKIYYGRDN
jgi:c-di-GMP-binding flagellar brake protein YcgR